MECHTRLFAIRFELIELEQQQFRSNNTQQRELLGAHLFLFVEGISHERYLRDLSLLSEPLFLKKVLRPTALDYQCRPTTGHICNCYLAGRSVENRPYQIRSHIVTCCHMLSEHLAVFI